MHTRLCAVLLLIAVAAGAAQAIDCPDLFGGVAQDATNAVVRDCTGSAGCDACQCSLIKAITPRLVQSGKILSSEAWMPSSLNTIADSLTQCKKEFAVQLLENSNASITQLASFDSCPTDVNVVSQCVSGRAAAAPAGDAAAAPAAVANGSMAAEVLQEACDATVQGGCPSPAAAQVVAGVPMSSAGGMIFAPVSDASVLRISSSNTRGPTTWDALCWCDDNWDPVCDGDSRKQYPNACSARCQNVKTVVPCGSLTPLVNQTMAGNTAVFVVDQSLRNAAAFSGPTPAEAPEDSQSFYYYYEDDADDTQDAMEITSTIAEAFLAARLGDESAAVDAVAKSLPSAFSAGIAANTNVTKADGPAVNATTPVAAGPLAALRNITITRRRFGLNRSAEGVRQRRNVSVAAPSGFGMQRPSPSWMMTSAPGYSAGVYRRDADRTSRILASLMAAAQEAKDNSRAAGVVLNLSPGLDNMVKAAQGAVEAARERVASLAPAGGLFRSAAPMLGNLTAGMNGTMTNLTSILTGNSTTNGTDAAPTMESDMDGMIDMVNSTRAANMTAAVNSTSAGNSTKAASRSKPQPKRRFMFF